MDTHVCTNPLDRGHSVIARLDGEMVELSILLPSWQADALENAAQNQGLTIAQMLRCVIRVYLLEPGRLARKKG